MKNLYSKSLFAALAISCSLTANSAVFNANGIFYDIISETDRTVAVTYDTSTYYTGDISIPATVDNEGNTYSVVEIGSLAFEGCWGMTSLSLPEGLKKIDNYALSNCTSIPSILIPSTVVEIGESAFNGCTQLSSVTLPASLEFIGQNAFTGCTALSEVNISDIKTMLNTEFSNETSNPLSIAHNLKLNGQPLESLVIESAVTIRPYAFSGCTTLKHVVLPKDTETISKYAFSGCKNISEISIPDNVKTIESWAFRECSGIQKITMGSQVADIGDYAFSRCESLTAITIPDNLTSLGESAFSGCSAMKEVSLGKGLTRIRPYTFQYCSELEKFNFGENVKEIGYNAFDSCNKLKEIRFTDNITIIDPSAFNGTDWFNSQPDGIVYAGPVAFKYKGVMPAETAIEFKEGTKTIANDLFYYQGNSLKDAIFPESLQIIGDWAFYNCSNLKTLTFPDNVEKIGAQAFSGCTGLQRITFGKGLTVIGDGAFNNADRIGEIHSKATEPPLCDLSIWDPVEPFTDAVFQTAIVTVPEASLEAYKAAKSWSKFLYIKADGASINNIGDKEVSVTTDDGQIFIEKTPDSQIEIYDISGRIVYKGNDNVIRLGNGIFIVKAGKTTTKVRL